MILTGKEIEKRLGKDIIINPYNPSQLNTNSYNLRLDNKLLVYDEYVLDMKKDNKCTEIIIPEEGLLLQPGKLYLGKTLEYTETNNLVPMLEGRSSIARLGISVHLTAGFGDTFNKLNWTLEITCVQPIRIYPNTEVCQIYYNEVVGEVEKYKGKYNGTDIKSSMIYKEFQSKNNNDIQVIFCISIDNVDNYKIIKNGKCIYTGIVFKLTFNELKDELLNDDEIMFIYDEIHKYLLKLNK